MGVGFGKVSDPLAFPFPSLLTCGSLAWSRGVGFLLQSSSGIFRRARFAQFSAHAAYAAPPTRPDPEIFFFKQCSFWQYAGLRLGLFAGACPEDLGGL